jgi:hypothetical protein
MIWRAITISLLFSATTSCAITENLKDGYQLGDITKGAVSDFKMYCGKPMSYIRKAGRTALLLSTGIILPDPCMVTK